MRFRNSSTSSREYAIQTPKNYLTNSSRMSRSRPKVSWHPLLSLWGRADSIAQNEIIETMTKLNEKQSSRIAALEKSLAAAQKNAELAASTSAQPAKPAEPVPVASTSASTLSKSDLKELKALREEVLSLRKGVKEKDQKSELARIYCYRYRRDKLIPSHPIGEGISSRNRSIAHTTSFYPDRPQPSSFNLRPSHDGRIRKGCSLSFILRRHDRTSYRQCET